MSEIVAAFAAMYREYPLLRAAIWAWLVCCVIAVAVVLGGLDAANLIVAPDRR